MNKDYIKLKIKLIAIVVMVLLLGCGLLTYQKADQIRDDYTRELDQHVYMDLRAYIDEIGDDLIQNAYLNYFYVSRSSDVGFYSMLKEVKTDATVVEDQNCIIIRKTDDATNRDDMRVILLGDDFGETEEENGQWELLHGFTSEIEFIGRCDDTYVYLDELKWKNTVGDMSYSYTPDMAQNIDMSQTVSFEEWAGTRYYGDAPIKSEFYVYRNAVCDPYGDLLEEMELNKEAREICEEIYADYADGTDTMDDQSEDGIFTCYIAGTGYISDEYAMPYVYVFHPISIAMGELTSIYVIGGVIGIVLVLLISAVIDKVHFQQLAYENNRRELTRGIAHELKTPLAVTKGYVENWEYLNEDERHESARIMIEEIDHMSRMVTDLLELSHLEAKAKTLILEDVDIYALTKSVLGRMKSVIDERHLVVRVELEEPRDDAYVVKADLEMMRVVLANFISNAVKYAKDNIDICMSMHKGYVKFVITNDGKAIANDKLDRVWDEFYKGESLNNSRIGSSGLGLAITKNILILHGAKYGCESNIGTTSFWFEIKQ